MNPKTSTASIIFCAIVVLSAYPLSVKADTANPFIAVSTPMAFTPAIQFPIPTANGTIGFAQIGYYENATLADDTWVFSHLQLDSPQTDLLSDSPTTANLKITTHDSNVTVTSFERLLTPDLKDSDNNGSWLTAGWLNYTVTGVGKQVINVQFNLANWTLPSQDEVNGTSTWPMSVEVYVDGKEAQYNMDWTTVGDDNGIIPYGTGVIVNGALSNVSIKYAWAPVPTSQSLIGSSLQNTKTSPESSPVPLLTVALASGIIVPVAVFSNRHRLESIINKKIKHKQHPC